MRMHESRDGSSPGNPLLLGSTLVRAGFATPAQVDECLEIQRRTRARGRPPRRLGDILVEKGYVTARQVEAALDGRARPAAARFGEVCLGLGLISDRQLEKALEVQRRQRARGREVLLGRILADMRAITAADVSTVLGRQGLEIAECTRCRVTLNVPAGCAPADLRCPRCARTLIFASEFEQIDLGERH